MLVVMVVVVNVNDGQVSKVAIQHEINGTIDRLVTGNKNRILSHNLTNWGACRVQTLCNASIRQILVCDDADQDLLLLWMGLLWMGKGRFGNKNSIRAST